MKVVKGIFNCLVSFCLCLVISVGFVTNLFSNMVLDKEYMMGKLTENEYYQKIEVDLKNGIEEYQYQSGLPAEVFENLYTSQMVKEDVDSIVRYLYTKSERTNHAESVKEKISQNIEQYLNENQITLTEEQQKNVNDFEEMIAQVYERKISAITNYLEQIAEVREKVESIVKRINQIWFGTLTVLGVIVLIVNLKSIEKAISAIGRSLLSSGILLEFIYFVIIKNIDIKNILLFSQSLSDFLKEILYDILSKFNFYGILFIIIGIGFILGASFYQRKEE